MSAIDTSKHFRIGLLFQVPIYQLLEDNVSLGHRISPQQRLPPVPAGSLVIGGGSGEYPAIALYDPEYCVARYLEFCFGIAGFTMPDDVEMACAIMQDDLQAVDYCNWCNQDHLDFRERCAVAYNRYRESLSFEGWLLAAVGEFLFHAIPSYSPRIHRWTGEHQAKVSCWFNVVSIPYGSRYGGNGRDRLKIVDTAPDTDQSPPTATTGVSESASPSG